MTTQHPSTTIQKVLNELPDLWSWSSDFPCLFPCLSLPPLSCFLQGIDSHDSRINSLSADFDRERVTMESTLSSVRQQVTPGSSMHCLTANNQLDSVLLYHYRVLFLNDIQKNQVLNLHIFIFSTCALDSILFIKIG